MRINIWRKKVKKKHPNHYQIELIRLGDGKNTANRDESAVTHSGGPYPDRPGQRWLWTMTGRHGTTNPATIRIMVPQTPLAQKQIIPANIYAATQIPHSPKAILRIQESICLHFSIVTLKIVYIQETATTTTKNDRKSPFNMPCICCIWILCELDICIYIYIYSRR